MRNPYYVLNSEEKDLIGNIECGDLPKKRLLLSGFKKNRELILLPFMTGLGRFKSLTELLKDNWIFVISYADCMNFI